MRWLVHASFLGTKRLDVLLISLSNTTIQFWLMYSNESRELLRKYWLLIVLIWWHSGIPYVSNTYTGVLTFYDDIIEFWLFFKQGNVYKTISLLIFDAVRLWQSCKSCNVLLNVTIQLRSAATMILWISNCCRTLYCNTYYLPLVCLSANTPRHLMSSCICIIGWDIAKNKLFDNCDINLHKNGMWDIRATC